MKTCLHRRVGAAALLLAVGNPMLVAAQTGSLPVSSHRDFPDAAENSSAAQLAQTEAHLRTYLETHIDSPDAHYLLASTLFREDKAKDSLAEYTRAAALRPPTAKDLQTVALDYVLLNDYADADHWMTRSVEEQPQNAEAWYQLGRIHYTENRFVAAAENFQKALALQPRLVKAENNLGLAFEGLNRIDEAIAAYRIAISWQQAAAHPSEQPLLNLAILLTNRGQLPEALQLATEADHIAPRDAKICEQLGRIYTRLGDLTRAQAALERAAALSPQTAAIHFELAQVYRKQGKTDEAKAESARVAALSGTRSTPVP